MYNILYATFAGADDGIQAVESLLYYGVSLAGRQPVDAGGSRVESLLYYGVSAEDISLILPGKADIKADVMVSGALGRTYDAPGAVIHRRVRGRRPASVGTHYRETIMDTEEGAGIGLGFGLLTAMCIPSISLIDSTGTIVASLMAAGTVAGGIAGGIYGYLTDRGVARGIARVMSHHVDGGGTTVSVTVSEAWEEAGIVRILEGFGGHLIRQTPTVMVS
jgi:hypothetical protein